MATKKRIHSLASRTKPKRLATQPIELAHVFLELTTSVEPTWDSHEPDNYITHFSGDVRISSDDSDCIVVRLSNAVDDGVSWLEILDSYNDEVALYSALVEPEGFSYSEWVQAKWEPFASRVEFYDARQSTRPLSAFS